MSQLNEQIRAKIDSFDVDGARQLLRQAVPEANAETYYLASMVAMNDEQKRKFLQKAVQLNPYYAPARDELNRLATPKQTSHTPMPINQTGVGHSYQGYIQQPNLSRIIEINGQRYELANVFVRGLSTISDSFFVVFTSLLLATPLHLAFLLLGNFSSNVAILISIIFCIFPYVIIPSCSKKFQGQTFSKKKFNIRVIGLNGKNLTFFEYCVRYMVWYPFGALILGIGFLRAFWDPKRQTWHDHLLQTVVIKVPRQM